MDGRELSKLPPEQRKVGLIFQDYALFPHLDVLGNVSYGLVEQRIPKEERGRRAEELLERMGLGQLARRRTWQLSGGQQQRVAVARSLATRPRLLLLDEPLSNLDAQLRQDLQAEIHSWLQRFELTAIWVTHDRSEAFAVGDRLAVLRAGRILQDGPPLELYHRPASAWIARFLGHKNLWPSGDSFLLVPSAAVGLRGGEPAELESHSSDGERHLIRLRCPEGALELELSSREWAELRQGRDLEVGSALGIALDRAALLRLPGDL